MCMQICLPSSETISQIMQMKCTIIHAESTPVVNLLRWDSVEDERQDHYDNLCEEYRNELYLLQEPFYLPIDKLSLEVPRVTVDINYKETATSSHYNPTINSNGKPKCAFKSVPFTCIPVAFAEIKTFQLIATIDKLWIKKENRNVSIILSSHSAYLPGDATDLLTSSHIEFGFHFEENTRNNLINLLLPLSAKRQIIHCSDNKEAISMIRRILLQVNRRYHLSLDCFRCKLVSHRDNIRTDSMIQFSILTHSQSPCTLDSNHLIHYRSQMFNNNKYNRLSNDWFGWRRRQSHWKYIITSEMLRDIENLNTKQSLEEKLLVESRSNVSLLLGWQVAVTSCEDERAEKPSTTGKWSFFNLDNVMTNLVTITFCIK